MAAMVEFAYRFPRNAISLGSRILRVLVWVTGHLALAIRCVYACQILVFHRFNVALPAAYGYFNPLTFLVALGVSVDRTIAIQGPCFPGIWGALRAFIHPQDRPARVLRNFSLALSIGPVQGYVSGVGLPASLSAVLAPTLINLSLLLMLAAVVFAYFDFPAQQPSLVVRLVGLTLVILLAVIGMSDLYNANVAEKRWFVKGLAAILSAQPDVDLVGRGRKRRRSRRDGPPCSKIPRARSCCRPSTTWLKGWSRCTPRSRGASCAR